MKKLLITLLLISTNVIAEGYYWHPSQDASGRKSENHAIACWYLTDGAYTGVSNDPYGTGNVYTCGLPDGTEPPHLWVSRSECPAGTQPDFNTSQCVEITQECEQGLEKKFSGTSGGIPPQLCHEGCEYQKKGVSAALVSNGFWVANGISTGEICTSDTGQASASDGTPGCVEKNGVLLCGAGTQETNCGYYNGVKVCTGANPGEGYVNGEEVSAHDPKNCGEVNGKYVCLQSPDGDIIGPQNSAPEGVIQSEDGDEVGVNGNKKTFTNKTTVTNPDGSITTTTTVTSNVQGEGTKTTTTTTYPDGTVSITEETGEGEDPEDEPGEEMPDQPGFDDDGYGEFIDGMGNLDSGIERPTFSIPQLGTGQCIGIPYDFGRMGSGVFDSHCQAYDESWRPTLEWLLYISTALYLFHLFTETTRQGGV